MPDVSAAEGLPDGARVIAVMNQKGGVGKTTTALNLSHAFARNGRRVLALDLDPQGQLAASLGFRGNVDGVDAALLGPAHFEDLSNEVREGLQLVPPGPHLIDVERMHDGGIARGSLLREALEASDLNAELVVLDCPPSSGLIGMNALMAADDILMPVSSDYLALHGLSRLMSVLNKLESQQLHPARKWIVLTRYQDRRRLAREVKAKLLQYFPGRVLATSVREAVALSESPSFGKTIFEYRPNARSAEEYQCLAEDFLCGRVMQDEANES